MKNHENRCKPSTNMEKCPKHITNNETDDEIMFKSNNNENNSENGLKNDWMKK